MNRFILGTIVLTFVGSAACGMLQFDRGSNDFFLQTKHMQQGEWDPEFERATEQPFVGLAISGGGSRSASFGAAVMQELDKFGFLEHVTAISAVSGGTLPAAYYVLNRNRQDWSWETLRQLVGTNFYHKFLWKHFSPWGFLNYLATEYNRSDMMADVFDDVLFHGATFGNLDPTLPRLMINAAPLHSGSRGQWSFTEENFRWMNSRIETVPISRAVAASTAVPGIYNGIALRSYGDDGTYRYLHFVDGGISENLGVETLLQLYIKSRRHEFADKKTMTDEGRPPRGCFIFAVDSYPDRLQSSALASKRDLRTGTDFIIDRNLLTTFDIMSNNARDRFFTSLKSGLGFEGPFFPVIYRPISSGYRCTIWHIHFGYLLDSTHFYTMKVDRNVDFRKMRGDLREILPAIETHWKLVAPGSCEPAALQDALYAGAKILVTEDRLTQNWVRGWFQDRGLKVKEELPQDFEEPEYEFFKKRNLSVDRLPDGSLKILCEATQ